MNHLQRNRLIVFVSAVLLFCATARAQEPTSEQPDTAALFSKQIEPFLTLYCNDCHSGDEPEGNLSLDDFARLQTVNENREVWLDVVARLADREMPPELALQPDDKELADVLTWLEAELGKYDCHLDAKPGKVTIHRLNRTEYNNTIRDLVGVDFQPAESFPIDEVGEGFDNLASVLSLPPLLMEKYLEAAEQITAKAFADKNIQQLLVFQRPSDEVSAQQAAEQVIAEFAKRAFRRPLREGELDRLVTLYQLAREQEQDFDSAIEFCFQAVLTSPHFLFRIELDDVDSPDTKRPLNGFEVASRLSYFLWCSMPDDALFAAAEDGQLESKPGILDQVQRMLNDPKSDQFVTNFAGQWLQLRQLAKLVPDPELFPQFDAELRASMQRETELFFDAVLRENRSVLDFLDSDFTFVNRRLAGLYGIDGIDSDEFQRVTLQDDRRGGVLTQASILTLTSNPTRTSPVKRGKWILDNLLGEPPPPPPAGVQELQEGSEAELLGSLRERMQQHRADPECAQCHRKMDALGFGFENFNVIGQWRDKDGNFDIDPSGELPGNQSFDSPAELRRVLRTIKQKQFVRCLTEKLLTYGLGRALESYDQCAVQDVMKETEADGYRFYDLVAAVVTSEPFLYRGEKGE
ncbi:MAG: DUF1592 domain-containing protein [Pirellulaceae bacterium]